MNANPKMSDHDNDESESSLESVEEPKHQDVQVAKEVENKNEEQVSEESMEMRRWTTSSLNKTKFLMLKSKTMKILKTMTFLVTQSSTKRPS